MSIALFRLLVFIIPLFVAGSADIQAQHSTDAQFGVIPDSLYQLESSPEYKDEPYIITNKEVDVSFQDENNSIIAVLEHHVRIKVFDETAPEASIVAIPYYFDDDMEQISGIEGRTYLPSGERIALQQNDIRTVNINSRYNVKEFEMPSVREGAILEYRYTIKRRYIEELPDFFLSHEVPTISARMTITYPRYMRYRAFVENFDGEIKRDIVYTDTSSVPKIFTIPQPKPIVTERWMAKDIPPVNEEKYISSLDDYRGKIKFLMDEFGIPRQTLENSWEVVIARMRRTANPWAVIDKNKLAWATGDSIAAANSSASLETVQDSIYHFVNKRVNFSGSHSAYSTTSDTAVLQGESVDQAAINQTLLAMLDGAGIEAYPVMVSTRESGRLNKDFPSFYQFNAQMVRSEIGEETYLMDAGFPYSNPGLIPVDMFSGPGLLLKKEDYSWVDINPTKSTIEIQMDIDANLNKNGTLIGTVETRQNGYPVQQMRRQKSEGLSDRDILKRALFDGYGNIQIDNVEIKNLHNFNGPVEISANFVIENYATSFSNGLEYRPMIVGYRRENPFETKNRQLPITFDAPEKLDVSYTVSIPSGLQVQERRGNQSLKFKGAEFEERYDLGKQQLNYEYHISIDEHQFPSELFNRLYQLYERWVTLSNSQWLIEN